MAKKEDMKSTAKTTATEETPVSSAGTANEAAAKAAETVKEAEKTTSKVVEKEATETAKAVEEKAKEAEKTVAKKTTAAKKTVKKVAAKTAAKTVEVSTQIVVQYQNNETEIARIQDKVKAQFIAEGHRASSIKKLCIYVKPEEYSAYYVINDRFSGRVDLF